MSAGTSIPVTVVVPVRDEEETIGAIVASLAGQLEEGDRLIVVETGSTDRTPSILAEAAARHPFLSVVEAPGAHPGTARNAGIEAAETDWIALLDAGTRVDGSWLPELRAALHAADDPASVDVVMGGVDPRVATAFDALGLLAYVRRLQPDRTRGPVTASMLLRRAAWARAGRFPDYRAAEDLAFFAALDAQGARYLPAPTAKTEWLLAPGWAATWRRFVGYSAHVFAAGMWRTWHAGTFRNVLLVAAFAAGGFLLHPAVALGVPLLYALRAARQSRGKWHEVSHLATPAPILFLGTMALLALIDLATLTGVARALSGRR